MFSISALTRSVALDSQLHPTPSFGKGKMVIGDPYIDKVSLSGARPEPELTYQHLAKASRANTVEQQSNSADNTAAKALSDPDRLAKIMQQVLDGKSGIDREKLDEIEQKIEALANKEGELTKAEQAQLDILQKQKEQLIKEGVKKLTETA